MDMCICGIETTPLLELMCDELSFSEATRMSMVFRNLENNKIADYQEIIAIAGIPENSETEVFYICVEMYARLENGMLAYLYDDSVWKNTDKSEFLKAEEAIKKSDWASIDKYLERYSFSERKGDK